MAHGTARTTVRVRLEICEAVSGGESVASVARRFGVSRPTVYRWWDRWQAGDGLGERSSRPHYSPRRITGELAELVCECRVMTGRGPAWIAWVLGMARSTVYAILRRAGLNRLPREPREPVTRYERARPGELLHIDTKKLGRISDLGPGWRIVGRGAHAAKGRGTDAIHVAIDDRTRVAYVEAMNDETQDSAVAFLKRAVTWYHANGIRIERVLTDNGPAYKTKWREACTSLGIGVRYTRPYRPQTNGKAERFIQTLLREWAYIQAYDSNQQRLAALQPWVDHYNTDRYHSAIGTTPWNRATSDLNDVTNVPEHYT